MNVDDFAKILIVIALSISLLGISYQIMRLIGVMADSFGDMRTIIKSFGELSEKFVADYDYLIAKVKNIVDTLSGVSTNIIAPLGKILGFVSKFKRNKKADDEEDDDEFEVKD